MSCEEERWRTQIDATISDPRDHTIVFNFNQPQSNEKNIVLGDTLAGFTEHRTHKRTAEFFSEVTKFSDGSRISQKTCVETEVKLYYKSKMENRVQQDVEVSYETDSSETPMAMSAISTPTNVHDEYRITSTRLL